MSLWHSRILEHELVFKCAPYAQGIRVSRADVVRCWDQQVIGIPELVAQSCLLITPNLTDTQVSNCTNIAGRTYGTLGHVVNGLGVATGANLLDIAKIGIDQGLLNVNVSEITDAYARIHGEVVIENTIQADGIRADGSFGQHGGVLYNGNYGKDLCVVPGHLSAAVQH